MSIWLERWRSGKDLRPGGGDGGTNDDDGGDDQGRRRRGSSTPPRHGTRCYGGHAKTTTGGLSVRSNDLCVQVNARRRRSPWNCFMWATKKNNDWYPFDPVIGTTRTARPPANPHGYEKGARVAGTNGSAGNYSARNNKTRAKCSKKKVGRV
jgi:hypothetical protein